MFGKKGKKAKKGAKEEKVSEDGGGIKKKRRLTPKLLFGVLITLAVVTIGAIYYFVIRKAEVTVAPGDLDKVTMGEQLVTFSIDKLPGIYGRIVSVNGEILLIEKEITRLKEIEKAYPLQKKITSKEIKIWEKILKGLVKSLGAAEKKIEQFYVAVEVNPEKGAEMIGNSQKDVEAAMDAVLAPSREATARLKPKVKEKGSLIDRVKDKIKNLI